MEKHRNVLPEGKPKCFPVVRFENSLPSSIRHLTLDSLCHLSLFGFVSFSCFSNLFLFWTENYERVNTFVLTLDMLSQILL